MEKYRKRDWFFLDPWTHTQTHIIWLEDKIRISYTYIPIGCSSIHYSFVNDSPHLWHVNWSIPFLFPPCNCIYITGQSHILDILRVVNQDLIGFEIDVQRLHWSEFLKNLRFYFCSFCLYFSTQCKSNRIHRTS